MSRGDRSLDTTLIVFDFDGMFPGRKSLQVQIRCAEQQSESPSV
jgi:hypothetical protein